MHGTEYFELADAGILWKRALCRFSCELNRLTREGWVPVKPPVYGCGLLRIFATVSLTRSAAQARAHSDAEDAD